MLSIVSHGIASQKQVESIRANPKFRRATRNMIYSIAAIEAAIERVPEIRTELGKCILIVATGQGEFETTYSFYDGLVRQNMARPFLFQSSLHNSTLGFLATHYQILRGGFTVSQEHFSGESGLDLAEDLLSSGRCQRVVLVGVDLIELKLKEEMQSLLPAPFQLSEGAGCLVLEDDNSQSACAKLKSISRENTENLNTPTSYYESQAIEALASAVSASITSPVRLPKPNGQCSIFYLETADGNRSQ